MKPIFAFRILLFFNLIFFSIPSCDAQNDSSNVGHLRFVGVGGYFFNTASLLSLEYGKRLKNRNELTIPVYFIKEGIRKEIIVSTAYHLAIVKKRSRFNFFISPEICLAYSWYERRSSGTYVSRYGYFFNVGLIPQVRITDSIAICYELKIGHGYFWAHNNVYYLNDRVLVTEQGWNLRYSPTIRLKYYFK